MGKRIKPRENEAGFALVWVLVLMLVAGLVLAPLLVLMNVSIRSAHVHEDIMLAFYAADAGIEDAAYKIQFNDDGLPQDTDDQPYEYTIADVFGTPVPVNDHQVDVTIENIWILAGLEDDSHGTLPHHELVSVGHVSEFDEEEGTGTYRIEMTYDNSVGQLKLDRVGAWLPPGFSYFPNSSGGITEHEDVPDNPEIIIDAGGDDPPITSTRGGTVLRWNFDKNIKFEELPPPGGGTPGYEFPIKRILYFKFTPAKDPNGAFSWMRTNEHDIYLSWDVASGTYKVTSTAGDTTIESYIAKAKLYDRIAEIYGDYRAIGNSLMYDSDGDTYRETLLSESSAAITKSSSPEGMDIPADAQVEAAYLYWAAWWTEDDPEEADTEITLQVDSGPEVDITASKWTVLEHPFLPHLLVPEGRVWHAYACFADVTDAVSKLNEDDDETYTITISDVDADVQAPDRDGHVGAVPWSYAGWSLVIIYSSAEEDAHQLYLYDQFGHAHDSCDDGCEHPPLLYLIEGFLAPSDAEAYLSYFVGEGDWDLENDYVEFKGESDTEWQPLYGGVNPQFNVMNAKSSGIGSEPEFPFGDGIDIDTFNVTPYLTKGDTTAELKITTHEDGWDLVYVILSFSTVPGTESGLFPVRLMTYTHE